MVTAYLSLGSNLGDRLGYLTQAVRKLNTGGTTVTKVSSVYETAPWGKLDQPAFLNIAAAVETELAATELLHHVLQVEKDLGRVRIERWGPRTVDIDILLYGTETIQTLELELPHPRMAERAFVLVPLLEIAPELPYPDALQRLPKEGIWLHLDAGSFRDLVGGVQ